MERVKRADTTTIEVNDKNCHGVTSSNGKVRYDKDRKGRIELPTAEAKRILASGHRDARPYRPVFSMSLAEIEERAQERRRQQEEAQVS